MPQITQNRSGGLGGGVIRWDERDWLAGLVPHFADYQNLTYGQGFAFSTAINPYRRPGYLMPGCNPNAFTNVSVIDGILKNGAVNNVTAYLIGGTKLHEHPLSGNTITNSGAWPHTISAHGGHSSVVGQDVIIYYSSTTKYCFYSWNDNTDGDVGRFDLSATFDDDFMTTVPTGASGTGFNNTNPKPMINGYDGILYIGNGQYVASYNATTNTVNYQALDLPLDYIITSFARTNNFLVIFAYRGSAGNSFNRSEATAFFWDYVSASFTYSYPLSGNYVNGGFQYNGTIGCFTYGRNSYTAFPKPSKMLIFDGSKFTPRFTFAEDIPGHGGVEVTDDIVQFNASGKIYAYGTPHVGFPTALNRIASGTGNTTGGLCRNFTGSKLVASSGSTTNGGLERFDEDFATSASWRTPFVYIPFDQYSKAQIKMVKVYWGSNAANGNPFTLRIYSAGGTVATTVFENLQTISATTNITRYEANSSDSPFPIVNAIQLEASYSSGTASETPPFPQAIEVYFEYINT